MSLKGNRILVTGGAVRIGKAIVLALADAGARVVVHTRASESAAQNLCRRITGRGGRAWVVQADLSNSKEVSGLMAASADAAGGPLDGLVNNAARFSKETLEAFTPASLNKEFAVNLFAPLWLMQAFAAQGRAGSIVNLLDQRVRGLDISCAPYVLTKKSLAEATRLAALTWAPRIRVNGIAPGAVLPPPGKGEKYLRDKAGPVPLQCRVKPRDIGAAVVFLMQAKKVTGQTLFMDGGQHLL